MELPIITHEDLSLIDSNALNENQLQHILKKTPKHFLKERPAKGGGTWTYVSGGYVKKCLNLMFGWDWDFEILDHIIAHGEVVVKGRLTCRSNGKTIVKTQYGNKDIICKKGTDIPLSIGNDLKSAATDCLKKCASEIGIASDVYNKDEFKEVKITKKKLSPEQDRILKMLQDCQTIEDVEILQESMPEMDIKIFEKRKSEINGLK